MEWEPVLEGDQPVESSSRRRLVLLVLVAVAILGAFVVFAGGGDDDEDSVASGSDTTSSSTSTTEATFDYLPTCAAQNDFRVAALSLSTERDPQKLRDALDVMTTSMRGLKDPAHPELVELVEEMEPLLEAAALELRGVNDASVLDALAQDPRFSSEEARATWQAVFEYPLRCSAG